MYTDKEKQAFDKVAEECKAKNHVGPYVELARLIYESTLKNNETCMGGALMCRMTGDIQMEFYFPDTNLKTSVTVDTTCHIYNSTIRLD
jgi:hypothetical protein